MSAQGLLLLADQAFHSGHIQRSLGETDPLLLGLFLAPILATSVWGESWLTLTGSVVLTSWLLNVSPTVDINVRPQDLPAGCLVS